MLSFLGYLALLLPTQGDRDAQTLLKEPRVPLQRNFFDIQAHRGGRGATVENTLPSFAWGLMDGATTLELDNGITKDGVVVVWHDKEILPSKCRDTVPAFEGDEDYPYVGKNIANLTLSQLRMLDCGSQRQDNYPLQLTYPGTRISTMQEVFDFAQCADPERSILWNIESKIDPTAPEKTKGVREFVERQHELFEKSGYKGSIVYQSFDWRTLKEMRKYDPSIPLSALIDDETATNLDNPSLPSPWLAGLSLSAFPGPTMGERVAQAAHALDADVLSPSAESFQSPAPDPHMTGYVPYTTVEMVREARRLGLSVVVWTVNRMNIVEEVMQWGVDGIISDYPRDVRRWAKQQGFSVAPRRPKRLVMDCLERHLALQQGDKGVQ